MMRVWAAIRSFGLLLSRRLIWSQFEFPVILYPLFDISRNNCNIVRKHGDKFINLEKYMRRVIGIIIAISAIWVAPGITQERKSVAPEWEFTGERLPTHEN